MTKALKAVLERAATWPEWAQDDLARLALEIDQEVSAGTYRATREELDKIVWDRLEANPHLAEKA